MSGQTIDSSALCGEWSPIATAPKDRVILLWWPRYSYAADDDGAPVMAIGQWKHNPRTHKSYFADTDEWDDYGMADNPPSHWMPLPYPPNQGAIS